MQNENIVKMLLFPQAAWNLTILGRTFCMLPCFTRRSVLAFQNVSYKLIQMLMGDSKIQGIVFLSLYWALQSEWHHWSLCSNSIVCPTTCSEAKESTLYIDWNLKSLFNQICCSLCWKKGVLSKALSGVKYNVIFHAFEIIFFWDVMRHTLQVEAIDFSEMPVHSPHGIPSQKTNFECICVYCLALLIFSLCTRLRDITFQ
jgi:hypothetical protein